MDITKGITIRATSLMLMALTAGLAVSRADVIQSTVELPPVSGAYALGSLCVSGINRCTVNAVVSDFNILSDTEQNGNEVVAVEAGYSADIFTDSGGLPDTFLGHLSLSGTADFTYVGRNPSNPGLNPLGTFTTNLTDFDFTGMLNGNTFEVREDAGHASTGTTTILQITLVPPIQYDVSSSLNIFAEYSFNGTPFVPAPERTTTLTASTTVPEPGSGALAGAILLGILGIASRRRIRGIGSWRATHNFGPRCCVLPLDFTIAAPDLK